MRLLFLGDVMGRAGRAAVAERLAGLRAALRADFCVVNGENASGGMGLTGGHAQLLLEAGADAFIKKPFQVSELMRTIESLAGVEAREPAQD